MSKARSKGTQGENQAITDVIKPVFPLAERRALHGIRDTGDVAATPLVWSIKRCESWPIHKWLTELYKMRENAGREMNGLVHGLILARRNRSDWVAIVPSDTLSHLLQKAYGKDASDV